MYNIESDDDEEDDIIRAGDMTQSAYLSELKDIQVLTTELENQDKEWKKERNKVFILKMLRLDEPVITTRMVDFLLQEGVCETLLDFITRSGQLPRPTKDDSNTDGMRIAYRACMVLTPGDYPPFLILIFALFDEYSPFLMNIQRSPPRRASRSSSSDAPGSSSPCSM